MTTYTSTIYWRRCKLVIHTNSQSGIHKGLWGVFPPISFNCFFFGLSDHNHRASLKPERDLVLHVVVADVPRRCVRNVVVSESSYEIAA